MFLNILKYFFIHNFMKFNLSNAIIYVILIQMHNDLIEWAL